MNEKTHWNATPARTIASRTAVAVVLAIVLFWPLQWWRALLIAAGSIAIAWAVLARGQIAAWTPAAIAASSAGVARARRWFMRSSESIDRVFLRAASSAHVRLTAYGVAAACLFFLAFYVASSKPPFAFYSDLGGDISAIGRMGTVATSLQAFWSMFNWQTWNDAPMFVYNTFGTPFTALGPELVLRDPYRTVKLMQVVQIAIGFLGTAWLYGLSFGKTSWRWLAAVIYALLPFVTLANVQLDFGTVFALIPVVLATNVVLLRRWDSWALPMAGLLCGIVGGAFYLEYAAVIGLPLLALTLAFAVWFDVRLKPVPVVAAFFAFALFPMFSVLPTLFGPHPISLAPSYVAALQAQSNLQQFSERLSDAIALVPRESLLSLNPALNTADSSPIALASGILSWGLLTAGIVLSLGSIRKWWPILAVGAGCTLLSLGPNSSLFGTTAWNLIARTPVADALRTPDRFAQIDALLVALGAVFGASLIARRGGAWLVAVSAACGLLVLGLLLFDGRAHFMALDDMDAHMPQARAIDRITLADGGRTAVLALPNGGSVLDFPPYGAQSPTVAFAWDVGAKYAEDDAGVALLRRSAVHSIVTSPAWAINAPPGMPDMATIVTRSRYARLQMGNAGSTAVFKVVRPRPMLSSVYPVCIFGGPGAFDTAADQPALDDVALIRGANSACQRTLYADYDPLDAATSSAVAVWPGQGVFGWSASLPAYPFQIDRFALSSPWFRQTYLGDTLLSAAPFQAYGDALSQPLTFSLPNPGRYTLYVRTTGIGILDTHNASGRRIMGTIARTDGFSWIRLPLGELDRGEHTWYLRILHINGAVTEPIVVDEVMLAPADRESTIRQKTDLALLSPNKFAPALAADGQIAQYLFPRAYAAATTTAQRVQLGDQMQTGIFDDQVRIRSVERTGRARFRWFGPSGEYALSASAWLAGSGSTLTISTAKQTRSAPYELALGVVPTPVYGLMYLRHGAMVDATMRSPNASLGSPNDLVDLSFLPVLAEEPPSEFDSAGESWLWNPANPGQMLAAARSPNVTIRNGALVGARGATAEIPFDPDVRGGTVSAYAQVGGLLGEAVLRCGSRSARAQVGSESKNPVFLALSVPLSPHATCVFRIAWKSDDFKLLGASARVTGPVVRGWSATQYLSSGNYAWSAGSETKATSITIDGRPWPPRRALHLTTGYHRVTLLRSPLPIPAILIRSDAGLRPPKPTVELAELNDGYWRASFGKVRARGYTCDIVNTCFNISGNPEQIRTWHEPPPALAIGEIVTCLDVLICLGILAFGVLRPSKRA